MANDEKLIIIMCGLPARGKSYITRKISNYLNWLNIDNKVFNVGSRRRKIGSQDPVILSSSQTPTTLPVETGHNADFFNPNSEQNVNLRDKLALDTLDELLDYLGSENGKVAVFDATNSTLKRRRLLLKHIDDHFQQLENLNGLTQEFNVLFLESVCTDQSIIDRNMALKLNGPDYINIENKELALDDFKKRLSNYEMCYQTVSREECAEHNCQMIKIVNITEMQSFSISGFLPIILHNLLNNFNITNKKIWVTSNLTNDISEISLNLPSEFSSSLQIYSNNFTNKYNLPNFHKINTNLNLDYIHDLIVSFEGSKYENILIQTTDELLINGLLKYFMTNKELFGHHIDFETEIICINPKLYSVGFEKFDIPDEEINIDGFPSASSIPSLTMTRSNSNTSTTGESLVHTPLFNEQQWQQFNYKNLNVSELSRKLEMLS